MPLPKKIFLAIGVFSFCLVLQTGLASAQSASASPTATVNQPSLGEQYVGQLREYKQLEREAQLARAQFYQLQTLESLADAVTAIREFLVSRDQVLITHLDILRQDLDASLGIPVNQKQALLEELTARKASLVAHQRASEGVLQVEELVPLVNQSEEFGVITNLTAATSDWIKYGKVRTAFDKAENLFQFIKGELESDELDPVRKARLEQDLQIIQQQIITADTTLKEIETNASTYSGEIGGELQAPYSVISRILTFVEEVAGV